MSSSSKEVPATFNARAESVVPRGVQAPALHHSGERLFRVDGGKGRQATASFHRGRRLPDPRVCRTMGPLAQSDDGRGIALLHNRRLGASDWMIPYHDRMPVLLTAGDIEGWLNGTLGADALRPAAEAALREWPVRGL